MFRETVDFTDLFDKSAFRHPGEGILRQSANVNFRHVMYPDNVNPPESEESLKLTFRFCNIFGSRIAHPASV